MTTAADDRADELAFEACLAGRPVPGGAAGLAAFTGAVRGAAAQPGRPNAALAELLATGLLTDQSSPSVRTAPAAGSSSRDRIRRRFAMLFPALLAKFLSAGAVAQAATGAGVVVVAVAGAGTAGVLPGPAQDTFTSLVSDQEVTETPEDVTGEPTDPIDPVDDGEAADPTEVPAVPELDEDVEEDLVPADDAEQPTEREQWAEKGPAEGQSFGSWVAEGARNGWVDGTTVSEWAHKRNEERRRAAEDDGSSNGVVESPAGPADGDGTEVANAPEADDRGPGTTPGRSGNKGEKDERGGKGERGEKDRKGNGRD